MRICFCELFPAIRIWDPTICWSLMSSFPIPPLCHSVTWLSLLLSSNPHPFRFLGTLVPLFSVIMFQLFLELAYGLSKMFGVSFLLLVYMFIESLFGDILCTALMLNLETCRF
ncbi:hypothetical protein S83_025419 [Arachis hypogaea]